MSFQMENKKDRRDFTLQGKVVPSKKPNIGTLVSWLPEPYKTKVLNNMSDERIANEGEYQEIVNAVMVNDTPHDILKDAFDWRLSREGTGGKDGRIYWSKVYLKLNKVWKKFLKDNPYHFPVDADYWEKVYSLIKK